MCKKVILMKASLDSDSVEHTAGPSQSGQIHVVSSCSGQLSRKDRKFYRKRVSRTNSPTSQYASDQGKTSYPAVVSPKKTEQNKRRYKSQNKFEFRTSSSIESLESTR